MRLGLMRFCPFGFGALIDLPSFILSKIPARTTTEPPRAGTATDRAEVRRLAPVEREERGPTAVEERVAALCIAFCAERANTRQDKCQPRNLTRHK